MSDPIARLKARLKGCRFLLVASWLTYSLGCIVTGPGEVFLEPTELCSDHDADAIATFVDEDLAESMFVTLGDTTLEDLTCGLLAGITELAFANPHPTTIENLVGIQNVPNLTVLDLSNNAITDITPLSSLKNLTELLLTGNSITNISALSGLTSLTISSTGTSPSGTRS